VSRRVLVFTTSVEAATGLAALAAPALVGRLLLGVDFTGEAVVVARCFGIALVALSVGCRPGGEPPAAPLQAVRGMALYNAGIAICLGYAGAVLQLWGPLLWPAVAIHAVVALLLIRPRSTKPSIS